MPEGMKGFQKGREKTGGRKKEPVQRVKPLIEMLKDNGFNFAKELANALHQLPAGNLPTGTKYAELMRLLPYMAPRLNERDVDVVDPTTEQQAVVKPISDEDLIKALNNGKPKQPGHSRAETIRPPVLPTTPRSEVSGAEKMADQELG